MMLDIGQKPVLVQVVRFGQPTGRCRPVRVLLKSPDTVHSILKDSLKLKSPARYSKVSINSNRTPKERIRHKELVEKVKNKIQVDSSKHWKISKGGVTSVDTGDPAQEVLDDPSNFKDPPLVAPNGEIAIPVKDKITGKEKRRKSYNFRRHRFT